MHLTELTPAVTSAKVTNLIKTQFGTEYNVARLGLAESVNLLNKTNKLIVEFKLKDNLHSSENNASYMKLLMLNEAATMRATELTGAQKLQESTMNKNFTKALKIAAMGGTLKESHIKALKLSENMQSVLRNQKTAQAFMRKIVESKKMLAEGEIDQAQTTIAAQDIADQIQSMIEKFADIKYKELPALHDSIRNAQGVDAAEAFNTSLTGSLDLLTSSLESTKGDVNNAIAVLTGQEVAGSDLDLDDFEDDDDAGLDDEMDLGDEDAEFDLDFEPEEEVDVDIGRGRR
jgi:hypothetical protein